MYDEVKYWNTRKNPNSPGSEETDVAYLRKHLEDSEIIVLDFGPGVGRTFDAYDGQMVCGYDITRQYATQVWKRAFNAGIFYFPVFAKEIGELPFLGKFFDVAVCCEVLHHQRPENIEFIMKDLLRVSNKVIVVAYHDPGVAFDKETTHSHCYNHDYKGICERNGWAMTDVLQSDNQLFFCYD